jgi:hypothetical protein
VGDGTRLRWADVAAMMLGRLVVGVGDDDVDGSDGEVESRKVPVPVLEGDDRPV